jgi:MFS family permease
VAEAASVGPGEPEHLFSLPLGLCFAANLVQGLAFNLFLHLPGYLHELGADEVEIGWISSLTAMAAIALRPAVGRAMDRRGRRIVILWGGVLNVVALTLYLFVDAIGPALYAVRILHGIAEAFLFSALFTYAADHVPARNRTQGLAWFGVSGMLPMSLGGVVGDLLLPGHGYTALFQLALVLAVISLAISVFLPEAPRPAPDGDVRVGFQAALAQRDLRPLWWIGAIFSIAVTAFFIFVKRYVDEVGLGSVGSFFTAYTAAAVLLRIFLGWMPDRLGPKRVLLPSLGLLALGLFVLAFAASDRDVWLAGVLCGIGHGFTFPILFGLVVTRTPDENRGRAMALYTALFDVGVLAGGPLFGLLIQEAGFAGMYAAAGALILFGAVVFVVWDARATAVASA